MAGDRTIAPTPARVRRAWSAGLRPPHRWLTAAAGVWAVTAVAARSTVSLDGISALRAELASGGSPDPAVVLPLLWSAAVMVAVAAAAMAGASIAVGIVTGTFGPTGRSSEAPAARPNRAFDLIWPAVAIAAAAVALLGLQGVIAGAARGVDGTLSGLGALWHAWGVRVGTTVGAVMFGVGALELGLERWRMRLRLYASAEELREQRRRGGGRSR